MMKKHLYTQLLSIVLAVVMLFSNFSVYAAEVGAENKTKKTITQGIIFVEFSDTDLEHSYNKEILNTVCNESDEMELWIPQYDEDSEEIDVIRMENSGEYYRSNKEYLFEDLVLLLSESAILEDAVVLDEEVRNLDWLTIVVPETIGNEEMVELTEETQTFEICNRKIEAYQIITEPSTQQLEPEEEKIEIYEPEYEEGKLASEVIDQPEDELKTGYFEVDGKKYYADQNGVLKSGWINVSDMWRYFDADAEYAEIPSETEDGYWYQLQDGRISYFSKKTTLAVNGFKTISEKKYYFDDQGFVAQGWYQDGTYWYFAKEDGQMVKGVFTIGEGKEAKNYYFNSEYRLSSGWKKVKNVYRYFQSDKNHENCHELMFDQNTGWATAKDGRVCYIESKNGAVTGWKSIKGFRYHFDSNGFLSTGLFQDGKYHYFAETIETATEESPLGNVIKGVRKIGDSYYGFHGKEYYRMSGWQTIAGKRYYFTNQYNAVTGWYKDGNAWYYADEEGCMLKGEQSIGEKIYYFDNEYRLKTGWVKIGSAWRFFNSGDKPEESYEINHASEDGWVVLLDDSGRKSYINKENKIVKGWLTLKGNKYYFDKNGMLVTGEFSVGNKIYYADEQGILQESGVSHKGWKEINGKKYYYNTKGEITKGFKTIEGIKYYFNSLGEMVTGWFTVDGSKYIANDEGKVLQADSQFDGWLNLDGKTYYVNSKGKVLTGFQTVNKKRFYFDSSGVMQSGWFSVGASLYYGEPVTNGNVLKGTLAAGAKEIETSRGNETYYFHTKSNYRLSGWQGSGKSRYYLEKDGTAKTGWFSIGGKTYYAEPETTEDGVLRGTISVGIKEIDGKIYGFHASKYYRLSGWQTVAKNRYYFGTDGEARIGWFKVGGKWYYSEPETSASIKKGALAKNFKNIVYQENNQTIERRYYFDSKYRLVTGWKTISKKRYFFQKDSNPKECYLICEGPSKKGWFTFEDGTKSYLNSEGKFLTGWQTISKKKYYFNSEGIMQTGWCKISGKDYYFNSDGIYIPITQPTFVSITSVDYGTVNISWKAISGVKGYTLQYSKDSSFPSWKTNSVSIQDPEQTKYTLEQLDGDTKYFFRIKYTVWGADKTDPDLAINAYSAVKNVMIKGEEQPTATAAKIFECEIINGKRNEGVTVRFRASLGKKQIKSADDQYYIVETESFGEKIDCAEPVASVHKNFEIDTEFFIGTGDSGEETEQAVAIALMNKFALAIKTEDGGFQLISSPMGITNPEAVSMNREEMLIPISKKGIQAVTLNERDADGNASPRDENAYGSNTKHTLFNIHINDLVSKDAKDGFVAYSYKGKTYYFSNCAAEKETVRNLVKGYPQYIKPGINATNQVAVTFVLLLEYDNESKYLIDPSARSKGHKYYTLNVREEESRETLEALFLYLGEIFGQEDCFVTHWVLGNEVNSSKAWNYQGSLSFSNYMKYYTAAFRLLYNGVKAAKTGNQVYISLDNGWKAAPDTYSGKTTLDKFAEFAQLENPEMLWSIAYHGYSYPLTRNDFWNDSTNTTFSVNTKYISMKNISVLTDYAAQLEEKYEKPEGSIRVILSEQGYNGKPNPISQAKALARGYYMAEFNNRIDAFIIRAIIDDKDETSGGLYLGIRDLEHDKRIAYFVYEYMDSSLDYMAQLEPSDIVSSINIEKFSIAKRILCETDWTSIVPGFDKSILEKMH